MTESASLQEKMLLIVARSVNRTVEDYNETASKLGRETEVASKIFKYITFLKYLEPIPRDPHYIFPMCLNSLSDLASLKSREEKRFELAYLAEEVGNTIRTHQESLIDRNSRMSSPTSRSSNSRQEGYMQHIESAVTSLPCPSDLLLADDYQVAYVHDTVFGNNLASTSPEYRLVDSENSKNMRILEFAKERVMRVYDELHIHITRGWESLHDDDIEAVTGGVLLDDRKRKIQTHTPSRRITRKSRGVE